MKRDRGRQRALRDRAKEQSARARERDPNCAVVKVAAAEDLPALAVAAHNDIPSHRQMYTPSLMQILGIDTDIRAQVLKETHTHHTPMYACAKRNEMHFHRAHFNYVLHMVLHAYIFRHIPSHLFIRLYAGRRTYVYKLVDEAYI